MTKTKKIMMVVLSIVMHVLLTGGVYVIGAIGCEILYECTDWWNICDEQAIGAFMVLLNIMWWISKGVKTIDRKIKEG